MKWRQPILEEVQQDFEKVAVGLQIRLAKLSEYMHRGKLVKLDGYTWCRLQNTDSNETFSLMEAERVASRFGEEQALIDVVQAISRHAELPAPIILDRAGSERPYLVAGNLCLMACRALNVTPMVWRISSSE
jgi:hypothetical protein